MSILSLRRFAYRYPQADSWALRDIDLELGPGLHLLAGESGSGKSTLLRVCNGLVPHFHGGTVSGEARLAGADIVTTPTRSLARSCGFLFQDSEMQSVYATVEHDVAFGLENLGLPRDQMHVRVDEALDMLGIEHLRLRSVTSLSGGERQRLALAGVLAMRPVLLALDEPLAQLDPQGIEPFVSLLRTLASRGVAVLVAEHRLEHMLAAAQTLGRVRAGRLEGPADPAHMAATLEHPPAVIRFGQALAWRPLALDVDTARARVGVLVTGNGNTHDGTGTVAWALDDVALNTGGACLLRDVSITGRAGEVTVLMGPNGGGKTTLLRAIAGLLAPASGRVDRVPGRVAYLPQNPTTLLHRETVRAEVALTLRHSTNGESPARMLDALQLHDVAERYPRDLSTGERQRAALAAVLAGTPSIALLDEPTRGMDGSARESLSSVIGELRANGTSIVLATHDSELAARVGDRILEVRAGQVRELGPPSVALSGDTPYATQMGRLFGAHGPVTVNEALALL